MGVNNAQLRVNQTILNAVEHQLSNNDPPETKATYNRLLSQGYDDKDARKLIGAAISTETFMIIKHKEIFDLSRYIATLRNLPRLHA